MTLKAVLLPLSIALLVTSCGNRPVKKEKTIEETIFDGEISSMKEIEFDNSFFDWKSLNGVELSSSYLSNKKVPHLNNGSLYCVFELGQLDSTLSVNINPSDGVNSKFSVQLLVNEEKGLTYKYLDTFNGDARGTGEKGVYFASNDYDSIYTFDISDYALQRAVVFITAYQCELASSGILLNSVKINNNDFVGAEDEYSIDNIISDWNVSGKVNKENSDLKLGKNGLIKKDIKVNDKNPFLKLTLAKQGINEPKVEVRINGEPITCVCTETTAVSPKGNEAEEFVYDLLDLSDLIVQLEVVNTSDSNVILSALNFIDTLQGYSIATSWTAKMINKTWIKEGNVGSHSEGICLHSYGNPVSISNITPISKEHCYFNLRARIFIRETEPQDEKPALALFVDDTLIRAIGYDEDRVSPEGGDFNTFVYNLSDYIGKKVMIKIENNKGPHACMDYLYLDATAEVEAIDE